MATNTRELAEARRLISVSIDLLQMVDSLEGEAAITAARQAAWRLADAGFLLREALVFEGITGYGITEPTGRGAILPQA